MILVNNLSTRLGCSSLPYVLLFQRGGHLLLHYYKLMMQFTKVYIPNGPKDIIVWQVDNNTRMFISGTVV